MEVRLIGTGSMWSVCNGASYLLDKNVMIDFPNGTFKGMLRQGLDPRMVESVLITHTHGDHILDLPVWALSRVKQGANRLHSKIYAPANFVSFLRTLIHGSFPESVDEAYFEYVTEDTFSINGCVFKRIPVCHGEKEAYGYMVFDGTRTVSFSGDTTVCDSLKRMASQSDILICDTAKLQETKAHLGVQSVIDLAGAFQDCSVITTHMNDETRAELLRRELPENLTVGVDGLVIPEKAAAKNKTAKKQNGGLTNGADLL